MAEFMRKHVEVLAVGASVVDGAASGPSKAEFEESETGLSVVPVDQWDQLQAFELRLEVPVQAMAEVIFPDIQHSSHRRIHGRRRKFAGIRIDAVEVPVWAGFYRCFGTTTIRRAEEAVVG